MNEIMNIKGVRARLNKNGDPELNLEDVSRGLGFTQIKNKTEYVRWETVTGYLQSFGFSQLVGKEDLPDYIAENIFYKLCFKAKNDKAIEFQDLVTDEILPTIRKHGGYLTPSKIEEVLSDPDTIIKLATTLKEEREKRLSAERQAQKLSIQLDKSKHWYTVKRVAQLNRVDWKSLDWRLLKNQSRKMGLRVDKIFDANFGTVNVYHEDVWKTVYPALVY